MSANPGPDRVAPREGFVSVEKTEIYCREIGQGQPIFILHGGPDFDHNYLLPDMDRLSDSFRLIYYDQRGRGKSARDVVPEDVSLQSDVKDLEALRKHYRLQSVSVLGHSWGALLAMEYAIRYPDHVSHLILMNVAPASHDDYLLFRQAPARASADAEELKAWRSDAKYQAGEPDAVAEYYRTHYRAAIRQSEHLEQVVERLRSNFTKEGILKARDIEDRLMSETWLSSSYNLFPKLKQLSIPTMVIHGDCDFVPVECAAHIAQAIPGARFVLLPETGHFSYLESPVRVHKEIVDFIRGG